MFQIKEILDIEKMLDIKSLNCEEESIERIKKFVDDYKHKAKRLEKILKISDKQQIEIFKLNESLNLYKTELEKMFEKEKEKNKIQEELIIEQSKHAAMGQMIDSIAHQWSQPLSVIQLVVDSLYYEHQAGLVDEEFVREFQEQIFMQVNHLTSTLHEFRDFYRPNKEAKEFIVSQTLKKVMLLQKDEFIKNQIEFEINEVNEISITGIENEFKHLLINLFNNAKDAYIQNEIIKNRVIKINIFEKNKTKIIEIIDNAGGIPSDIIDNIFKLNFTTKASLNGTGVGLHLCKEIVEKHKGKIEVSNVENGAKFTISFE